jgi:colanic acid/amylovoran biosynthesis glycosyltransferase
LDFIRLAACKQIQPDLIHNQWSPSLAALEPLFSHYHVFQSLHGRLEDVTPFHDQVIAGIYKKFFPKLAGVQAVSGETLKNASLFGAPTSNAIITYANVDSHWVDKARHSDFKIVRKSQLNIISVGNYVWSKGYIYALEAMKQLKDKSLNFHYKIIGNGDETQYRFHANDLGLNGFVTLQNKTPHYQVIKEIKDADLLLLPSIQEGFGAVVSESMAVGTPVLTTDCRRKIEVLKNGVDSLIVPSMSSSSIAKGIEEFLAMSAHDEQEIISNAKLKVKKYLTYEVNITKYLNIYKKALS